MKIELCFAANQKYFPLLFVAAASAAINADHEETLSFNIIDGGIDNADFNILETRLLELHKKTEIRRFKISEATFATYPDWRGNKMAYARFMILELRPELDFVIYCDCDYLWQGDVCDLWAMRDEAVSIQACRDPGVNESGEPEWYTARGFEFPYGEYFCTGLLLMNLRRMRELKIVDQVYELLRKHPDFMFPDQGTLNIVVRNDKKILDDKWMRFTKKIDSSIILFTSGLHYVNDLPTGFKGEASSVSDSYLLWHLYNAYVRKESLTRELSRFMRKREAYVVLLLNFLARSKFLKTVFYCVCILANKRGCANFIKRCASSPLYKIEERQTQKRV